MGTAHGPKVAPRARPLGWRRHEKSPLHRTIDKLKDTERLAFRVVVDLDRPLGKATRRRAIEQPAADDARPKALLHCHAVQHRLEHRTATNNDVAICPILARLVVGDPEPPELPPAF